MSNSREDHYEQVLAKTFSKSLATIFCHYGATDKLLIELGFQLLGQEANVPDKPNKWEYKYRDNFILIQVWNSSAFVISLNEQEFIEADSRYYVEHELE